MRSSSERGFSLLELLAAIAVGLTLAGITVMAFVPVFKTQHTGEAYNETLTTMRRARDQAATDMRIYVVTFTAPGTIVVQQAGAGNTTCTFAPSGNVLLTTVLPPDVQFQTQAGIPTSNTTAPMTPDQFGTGGFAFDLDEANNIAGVASICFNPDGTTTDNNGNLAGGVVYLGRTGDLYSERAVTVWGATGRIRGWRLYSTSGGNAWSQQ